MQILNDILNETEKMLSNPYKVVENTTLKANNLVAVEEIAQVSSRLIVNQAALKLKRAEIQPLIDAFTRAVFTAAS